MIENAPSKSTIAKGQTAARIQRVEAVVNAAGGGVESGAAEKLASLVARFGITVNAVTAEPAGVEGAVRDAVAAAPDLLVILAGDGTARFAAQLCGPDGPLVAPLPGGTMNVLPNALYKGRPWLEALESALTEGAIRSVAGGCVEGRSFYVAAILGAPALWAPAREAVRSMELAAAWRWAQRALSHAFSRKLRFALDGGPNVKTEALALLCPMISLSCEDEAAFEAAALNLEGAAAAFRLGANALLGDWRSDPSVSAARCLHAQVWAKRRIPCILDGEMVMLGRTAEITFSRNAFRALAPAARGT
jgi:diacylglycerol kinase family enzyme